MSFENETEIITGLFTYLLEEREEYFQFMK